VPRSPAHPGRGPLAARAPRVRALLQPRPAAPGPGAAGPRCPRGARLFGGPRRQVRATPILGGLHHAYARAA
jgi:hypothetical protein